MVDRSIDQPLAFDGDMIPSYSLKHFDEVAPQYTNASTHLPSEPCVPVVGVPVVCWELDVGDGVASPDADKTVGADVAPPIGLAIGWPSEGGLVPFVGTPVGLVLLVGVTTAKGAGSDGITVGIDVLAPTDGASTGLFVGTASVKVGANESSPDGVSTAMEGFGVEVTVGACVLDKTLGEGALVEIDMGLPVNCTVAVGAPVLLAGVTVGIVVDPIVTGDPVDAAGARVGSTVPASPNVGDAPIGLLPPPVNVGNVVAGIRVVIVGDIAEGLVGVAVFAVAGIPVGADAGVPVDGEVDGTAGAMVTATGVLVTLSVGAAVATGEEDVGTAGVLLVGAATGDSVILAEGATVFTGEDDVGTAGTKNVGTSTGVDVTLPVGAAVDTSPVGPANVGDGETSTGGGEIIADVGEGVVCPAMVGFDVMVKSRLGELVLSGSDDAGSPGD